MLLSVESLYETDLAKRNGILFPKLFEPKYVFILVIKKNF